MNKIFIILLLFLVAFSGCRQQKNITKRYYVLEMPAQEKTVFKDTISNIDKFCEVSPVNVYPAFATNRIALRGNTHEVEYFRNHEWAIRPAENFTNIIIEFFERYEVFKGVDTRYWRTVPDYRLETTIYQLEVLENRKKISARINLEFRLIDIQTDQVILKHSADRYKQLEENKINLFAAAISEMFYQELINTTKKITSTIMEQ